MLEAEVRRGGVCVLHTSNLYLLSYFIYRFVAEVRRLGAVLVTNRPTAAAPCRERRSRAANRKQTESEREWTDGWSSEFVYCCSHRKRGPSRGPENRDRRTSYRLVAEVRLVVILRTSVIIYRAFVCYFVGRWYVTLPEMMGVWGGARGRRAVAVTGAGGPVTKQSNE
eukprot:6891932-Pyramimonas_sp.AAC.1